MGGGERVLTSLYSSRANETGLVLSEYSHSLKTIVHRPVYMEGESEDANVKKSWWMRRTPPNQTKLFRMRRMPDSNFYINNIKWSEISGIVLMEIIDIKENVARIALFEFC
ncbi:hypothetical protein DL93DRAFT_2072823 [Clavulina sp. PMI_390]|nr:hypothetical protein DL93DRAFT_2072823 [Clavulina sp. PMI_390]